MLIDAISFLLLPEFADAMPASPSRRSASHPPSSSYAWCLICRLFFFLSLSSMRPLFCRFFSFVARFHNATQWHKIYAVCYARYAPYFQFTMRRCPEVLRHCLPLAFFFAAMRGDDAFLIIRSALLRLRFAVLPPPSFCHFLFFFILPLLLSSPPCPCYDTATPLFFFFIYV